MPEATTILVLPVGVPLSRPALLSGKIRFYARAGNEVGSVDADIFKDGIWENLYGGIFTDKQLVEKEFSPGTIS